MTFVYKVHEVKIKLVQEQWFQLKIAIYWEELSFGEGGY